MPEIMVSAGEVSGDRHAAILLGRLRETGGDIRAWGIGGPDLAGAGAEIVCNTVERSVLGFAESLKRVGFYYSLFRSVKKKIKDRKPDLILLVDFTAFNMKLAEYGHKEGIPVVSFFSPSAWAWGGWRAAKMARWKVKIAAVLPMEYHEYRKAGADVCFVGHPLPYIIKNRDRRPGPRSPIIAILPGSREMEIKSLLPEFLKAAGLISQKHRDCLFVLPLAAPHLKGLVEITVKRSGVEIPLQIVDGMSLDVIESSQLVLTACGTATLEAACLGVPMLAAYRVSPATEILARLLVKVKYFSLPNIILGEQVVPEFLQNRAGGRIIGEAALKLLADGDGLAQMRSRLGDVALQLGDGKAFDRVAGLILDILDGRRD